MRWCKEAAYSGLWAFELEEPDMIPALRESKQTVEGAAGNRGAVTGS